MKKLLTIFVFIQSMGVVFAQKDSISDKEMPQIEIIAEREGILSSVPGAVAKVGKAELKRIAPLSANEVLRKISGINVVDEEGAGLRVNIGIRGLDPDRSRNVLVLEDGIPVALNPYGEPEMYYSPVIDRMSGIEVLKGSGQILFGPQTIGGVVNYITQNPPTTPEGKIKMTVGENGLRSALAAYGATYGNVGFQTTFLRKQAEDLGYTGFKVNDFATKIRLEFSEKSNIGLKFGIFNENSDATYIGLTQTMYDSRKQDFVKMAPSDELQIRRYSASLTHQYRFSQALKLQTTAFAYTTTRNWQRQDFSLNPTATNQTGVIWGDKATANGAVFMLNSNAHRNRQFEVVGIEPKLQYQYNLFSKQHTLQSGLRFLQEKAFEQRENGSKFDAKSGALVEDEIRTGKALSAYIHNKMAWTERFSTTFGVRSEWYNYERQILRNSFMIGGKSKLIDTNLIANNAINAIIPGIGFNYSANELWTVFGGLHKGFAPPRIKDAISNQGEVYNLSSENSWNGELGIRGNQNQVLQYELTSFYTNFSNQIIPVSQSSGGSGVGLVNGGKTLHYGVELAYQWDIAKTWKKDFSLLLSNNFTFSKAFFNEDRFVGTEKTNIKGNLTPYAPRYYMSASLYGETPKGLGANMTATFVGSQFSNELNTIAPSPDGRIGKIAAYQLFDANVFWNVKKWNTSFNIACKNIFNERYIATRRPQGIRLGLPRFLSAGVEVRF